ncbi:MAG: hypothetical protein HUU35_11295 [Armatimonadetes bacterium]|nr:hypothetical protein [Armatimonadota bacterium]
MSRPYRIVVQKVVEQDIRADDRSTLRLKLDPVLPEERLTEVLEQSLARHGWRRTADGVYEKERGEGESMTCDIEAREVTTVIEIEETVRHEVRKELRGDTWNWRQMREMTDEELEEVRRIEEARLEAEVSAEEHQRAASALRETVRERLESGADERRREVNRIVLEVMSEALKERAGELGNVQHIDEKWDGEDYELTISVAE